MILYRQVLRRTVGMLAALVVLAVVLLAALPRVIDLPAVQARLERRISHAVAGQVEWSGLQFRVLPLPAAVLHGVRWDLPVGLKGSAEEIVIDLPLQALVRGHVEISAVRAARLNLELVVDALQVNAETRADPMQAYRSRLSQVRRVLREFAPAVELTVEDGNFRVCGPGSVVLPDAGGSPQASAGPSVNAEPVPQSLLPGASACALVSEAVLRMDVQIDGQRTSASLDLDASSIALARAGQGPAALGPLRVAAVATLSQGDLEVAVSSLRIGEVVPTGSGTLRIKGTDGASDLAVELPTVEWSRLRDVAQVLGTDHPRLQRQIDRIRAGQISEVHIAARAASPTALLSPGAISARARVEHGVWRAPAIERDITGISGRIAWEEGQFVVADGAGQLQDARADGVQLAYAVADRRLALDAAFDLGVAPLLNLARPALHAGWLAALDRVESARGRASGRMELRRHGGEWAARVDIERSDAKLRLRRIPLPLALAQGKVAIEGARMAVTEARGALGRSTFSGVAAEIGVGKAPLPVSIRGDAQIVLAELYPWVRSQAALEPRLRALGSASGTVKLTVASARGPWLSFGDWTFDLTARPRRVQLEFKALPGPLLVDEGAIRATRESLAASRLNVALLDSRMQFAGALHDYPADTRRLELVIDDAVIDEQLADWAWQRAALPVRFMPAMPVHLAASRLRWSNAKGIDLAAALRIADAEALDVALIAGGEALEISRLNFKDAESDAMLALRLERRRLDARFEGKLTGRSAGRLFKARLFDPDGSIDGRFRLSVDGNALGQSTAEGSLAARSIDLSALAELPVTLDRLDLQADGEQLRIGKALARWQQQPVTARGDVRRGASGPVVDLQIETPGIVIDALLPAASAQDTQGARLRGEDSPTAVAIWPLPLSGIIDLRAGFLAYGQYRAEGIAARLTLEPTRLQASVSEATLCGMGLPVNVDASPDGSVFTLNLRASGEQIDATVRCLTQEHVLLTGTYDLQAEFRSHGVPGEYLRNAQGSIQVAAQGGEIMRWPTLGDVLSLAGVTDGLLGGGAQAQGQGFPYREIQVSARLGKGTVTVREATLDSNKVGLAATGTISLTDYQSNLTALVAPLGVLDQLVRKLPVLGYVFGGSIVSLPVGVTGDIRHPRVVPLSPSAVTDRLLGIAKRTLRLPARLVDTTGKPQQQEGQPGP